MNPFNRMNFFSPGNNPLVPIGMVLGMAVLPLAIIGGIVGGALWLGYSAITALATGTSMAIGPGAVLGGAALLVVGHYTGALQGLGHMMKTGYRKFFPEKPKAEPAPTTDTWKEMVKDLDAKRAFRKAQEAKPAPAAETPAPAAAPAPSAPPAP